MIKKYASLKNYVEKVVDKFDMSDSKDVTVPLVNHFKLLLDQCSKTDTKAEYMSKVNYVVLLIV